MNWYYAENNQQLGPVSESEFHRLASTGVIRPDTLVWHEGMSDWQPYGQLYPQRRLDSGASPKPEPSPDLAAKAAPGDLEGLWAQVRQGGYPLSAGECISQGASAATKAYLPMLGASLVFFLIVGVSQNIPLVSLLTAFLVLPQITAGMWWYFLRHMRGEDATLNDLFEGFRRGFGQLALVALIQFLLIIPLFIIIFVVILGASIKEGSGMESDTTLALIVMLPLFAAITALVYVYFRWFFAHILILDQGLNAMDSLRMSWRMVGMRFWTLAWFFTLIGLIYLAGMLAFIIGALFVTPICWCAMAKAYDNGIPGAEGDR